MLRFLLSVPIAMCVVIDVVFDEFNSPFIQGGTVPGLYSLPTGGVEMYLSLGRSSVIDVGPETDPVLVTGEVYTRDNFPLCPSSHPALSFPDSPTPETAISIAIGPRSFLMNNHNSTALVRNGTDRGYLVLGESRETFVSLNCVSNSSFRIPFTIGRFGNRVNVSYSLIWSVSDNFTISQIHETTGLPVTISGHTKILKLPVSHSLEIVQSMTPAVWVPASNFYSNCEISILTNLPHIRVTFHELDIPYSPVGDLFLSPSDYVDFDEIRNTCFFRFSIEDDDTDFLSINPLVIPNVNFFFTNNELLLCDSTDQD